MRSSHHTQKEGKETTCKTGGTGGAGRGRRHLPCHKRRQLSCLEIEVRPNACDTYRKPNNLRDALRRPASMAAGGESHPQRSGHVAVTAGMAFADVPQLLDPPTRLHTGTLHIPSST